MVGRIVPLNFLPTETISHMHSVRVSGSSYSSNWLRGSKNSYIGTSDNREPRSGGARAWHSV